MKVDNEGYISSNMQVESWFRNYGAVLEKKSDRAARRWARLHSPILRPSAYTPFMLRICTLSFEMVQVA